MSVVTDIADAVVTALNAGTFSQAFAAVVDYEPEYDIPECQTLRVTVVPASETPEILTRGKDRIDVEIHIGFHKKVNTKADVTTMLGFVKEISGFMNRKTMANAKFTGRSIDPLYSYDMLKQKRTFFSLLILRYLATEEVTP